MKRFVVLLSILFYPLLSLYPQNIDFPVTTIEVSGVSQDTVVLRWNSNIPEGEFSVYYHNQIIRDQFILFDSQLAIRSNFTGVSVGSVYQYEYRLTFKESGDYFFAVLLNDTRRFDNIARTIINEVVPPNSISLIPEINITAQAINICFIKPRFSLDVIQKQFKTQNTVLTSLELKSLEDVFSLRWSVFPKDLSQYIFVIYRSRYPIVQYGTPQGLPEYARVTNQFSFEDRNIVFETPYYYAVVVENTTQWDPGINVFSQPAILLRKSPPLSIKPTLEYIKRQKSLALNFETMLTEEEIEQAVQQTLSNLYLVAMPVSRSSSLSEILDSTTAPIVDLYNTSDLNLQQAEIKLNNISSSKYYNTNNLAYKNFILELKKSEEKILKDEYSDFNNIIKEISDLSKKIEHLKYLEKDLLGSDHLLLEPFKKQLNAYYNQIDQIRISRFRIQGVIKGLKQRRKEREQNFLELKQRQTDINKAQEEINKAQEEINKSSAIFSLDQEINRLQQSISNNQMLLKLLEQKELNSLVQDIVSQVNNTDLNTPIKDLKKTEGISKNKNDMALIAIRITKEQEKIDSLIKEKKTIRSSNSFTSKELLVKEINISSLVDNRLQNIQGYYKDVTVEKIPDISELTNEKWLVVKQDWLQNNKEIWLSKQNLWKRRIQEILGSDYQRIASKWMNPSREVALIQGRKAFQDENFKEAAYLLQFVSTDHNALIALGQSYYHLGAYRDAFTVFITAFHMQIPESRYWMNLTAGKILERNL
ncbi:MAG: hypothetical protein ACRC0X_04535 [Brevinema sp.]